MSPDASIAYISDVGAQSLKPLFIAGSVVTTIFLDASFISERCLRHSGSLVPNTSAFQKTMSGLSMAFAVLGTAGLILLSIFDTLRHPNLHDIFLLLFIAGYIFSAIFVCAEYQRLGVHFREHRILRASFWTKLSFIILEVLLTIAFASCTFKGAYNVAAVLEWIIAFIFTFYVGSFFIDLIPALWLGQPNGEMRGSAEPEMQMEQNSQLGQYHAREGSGFRGLERGNNVTSEDSERALTDSRS